ncbi:MAG: alanine racemase [Nevskiales bacterium]
MPPVLRAQAEIDLRALPHNLARVRACAPGAKVMAAVKANGYGHGAAQVARTLSDAGCEAFAVATVAEGQQLRQAGIAQPVIVLNGVLGADDLYLAVELGLRPVVHDFVQLERIEQADCARGMDVWVKLDTGMHRLGLACASVPEVAARLQRAGVRIAGWMTHLACADEPAHPLTLQQIECFRAATAARPEPKSIANSAGILAWPQSHTEWVRPGIMLYGASPMPELGAADHQLKPVMSLSAPILAMRQLRRGEGIGYGQGWRAPEDMPVGVLALGYGDGYPRQAQPGTPIWIKGSRTQLIGRVSMDLIALDLRGCGVVAAGDRAELWGKNLSADEVARHCATVGYDLFCGLTRRVSFEYLS